jgi:hypothetical protein
MIRAGTPGLQTRRRAVRWRRFHSPFRRISGSFYGYLVRYPIGRSLLGLRTSNVYLFGNYVALLSLGSWNQEITKAAQQWAAFVCARTPHSPFGS